MMKKILYTVLFFLFLSMKAIAHIDVVYPTSDNITVNTSSIFFIGNTNFGSELTINSDKVKLWDNNFFVHVIPLKYGKNYIKMTSTKNGIQDKKIYTVTRLTQDKIAKTPNTAFIPKSLYTKTIKSNATVREKPSTSANRVVELPIDTVLYLSGQQGDYYKIDETGDSEYWIHKSNVKEPINANKRVIATLKNIKSHTDSKYEYVKFHLNYPVLYTLKQDGNTINLTLYGINGKNYTYSHTPNHNIIGYEAFYDDNTLVLKTTKVPKIKDENYPLKDIAIFIDPGHGGTEKGSVGPTGTCEKDVNLAISRYLMKYLEKEGAKVVISRLDDRKIDLYDRVNMAKKNEALISLSIHNNALADGKDPYIQHGTEVHYYNENAKLLSEIIKNGLVENLNFKDNGIHKSSFALNRSTNPVSVLVECAYMINPEEYMRLRNPVIQRHIAKSIKNSLKKFIVTIQK